MTAGAARLTPARLTGERLTPGERPVRRPVAVRALRRWAAVVATAAALTLAACGVPDAGPPIVDGGITLGAGTNQSGHPINPPLPGQFSDPGSLVTSGLLYAVAGQTDVKEQVDDFTAFGTTTALWAKALVSKEADAPLPVTVIRVAPDGVKEQAKSGGTQVTVEAYVVGEFDPATGAITPAGGTGEPEKFVYQVVSTGSGLRIASAPADGLYVVDAVFDPDHEYYAPRTVYFWSAGGGMIGDLRYVSKALSTRQAATTVVYWLLAGPPKWLASVAIPTVPAGTVLADPVISVDPKTQAYVVNLKQSQPLKYAAQFATEVAWSLPPTEFGSLQPVALRVNNAPVALPSVADMIAMNQALPRSGAPVAYAIEAGKVLGVGQASTNGALQVAQSGIGAPTEVAQGALRAPKLSPGVAVALGSDVNTSVVYGAIHETSGASTGSPGDRVDVALVRQVDNAMSLWVSQSAAAAQFHQIRLPAGELGQPHWIPAANALGIVVGGHLYVVAGTKVLRVNVPDVSSIVAFSVAADGRRIAYVTGAGRVLVGLLDVDTTSDGTTVTATAPTAITVGPQLTSATAVAWSSMSSLVVGGPSDHQTGETIEINVDGVYTLVSVALRDYGASPILAVSSYPLDPLGNFSSPVLVQTSLGASAGRSSEEALPGTDPFFED